MNKKSLFKVIFSLLITGIVVFATISCEVGMGESIDLKPPFLQIDKGIHGSYQPKVLTLTGDAYDDRHLDSVVVNYSYNKNGQKITGSKKASTGGGRWSATFTFDGSYEVEFEAYAYDMLKNGSDTSHDRAMVLIDDIDPSANKMSIVRGNYVARLLDISQFTGTGGKATADQINEPQNKDYFQNESFKINSNLKDNYGIGSALLDLYEGNTLIKSDIKPIASENKFAPEFEITEAILGGPGSNKICYIRPVLKVKDEAGNPIKREDDGIFAWYPEYNTPHVKYTTKIGDMITLPEGNTIPVTIFDDDDLASVQYAIIEQASDSETAAQAKTRVSTWTTPSEATSIGERVRDLSIDLPTTGKQDGMYWLVVKVVDKSANATRDTYLEATKVKITNADVPTITVTYPTENSVPSLGKDTSNPPITLGKEEFIIKATVSDNAPVEKIAIAWLPNGNSDLTKAQTYFENTYNFASDTKYSGINIWKLPAGTPTSSISAGKTTYTHAVNKKFNFYNDVNGANNVSKVFMIAAKDKIDQVSVQVFRLSPITATPAFEFSYLQKDSSGNYPSIGWSTRTTNPLLKPESVTATKFRVYPVVGETAPVVTACTVTKKSSTSGVSNAKAWNATDGYYEFEVENPNGGQVLEFDLTAKDKVNQTANGTLTILFNEIGVLKDISCGSNANKVFTAGEKIRFQANFTSAVKLNNGSAISGGTKPYIWFGAPSIMKKDSSGVLEQVTDLAEFQKFKAEYVSGSGTSTLYFEYTVPSDVEMEFTGGIRIQDGGNPITGATSTADPIHWEGVSFDGISGGAKNAWANNISGKNYGIDTAKPYIVSITPGNGGVVTKKTNGSIDIVLTFNENVWVESGTIIMQRTAGWYIPPVLDKDKFVKIWTAAGATDKRKDLCGSDTTTFAYGKDPRDSNVDTLIAKGPYMIYTNGIKEKTEGGYMVPDVDTKYVLRYDLDIGDTTSGGEVDKVRKALESVDYHKATIDASGNSVSASHVDKDTKKEIKTNKVTITVTDANFIDRIVNGVEYFLSITPEAIRDESYNYYRQDETSSESNDKVKIGSSEYKFWVGPVAKPVVRVNRVATNNAGHNPTAADGAAQTHAKIDCETPGATIAYGIDEYTRNGIQKKFEGDRTSANDKKDKNKYTDNNTDRDHPTVTDISDARTRAQVEAIIGKYNVTGLNNNITDTPATVPTSSTTNLSTYTNPAKGSKVLDQAIGDNKVTTCQKIYIAAKATKTGFDGESDTGMEGAYKTVLHYYHNNNRTLKRVYGAQSPEGTSFTAGWPLTQNSSERQKYQVPYQETKSGNDQHFYWVSWQILTDFTLQVNGGEGNNSSFQDPAFPYATYGAYIYAKNKNYYNN